MLAVAGGKGGCGKTTTAACLARAVAEIGANPVVADGDVDSPDLHLVAGATSDPGLAWLAAGRELDAVVRPAAELPGVRLLPGGGLRPDSLASALHRLGQVPDRTIVDAPPGASPAVAACLRAADATIVVSTPTRRSLADAAKTAAMARALDAPVVGAVVTRSDGDAPVQHYLNSPALAHVPPASSPLEDARVRERYAAVAKAIAERNV